MKRIATLMMMMIAIVTLLSAQTADEVIDKYFENSGGKENFRAIETLKTTGLVLTPQGDFPVEIYQKAPDKIYVTLDIMEQKIIPQATDGETAWSYNPFSGSTTIQKLNDSDAAILKEEADIEGPFIDYAEKGYTATYEGTEVKRERSCHIVKLEKELEGSEFVLTCYFDVETFFPIAVKRVSGAGQYAGQLIENYYDNYQDTGNGLIMPFGMETFINGQSAQNLIFKSIEVNIDIPDDIFTYTGE